MWGKKFTQREMERPKNFGDQLRAPASVSRKDPKRPPSPTLELRLVNILALQG